MPNESEIKHIMLEAIMGDEEAQTISLRTAGAVVNAIYDALKERNVLATK
jgi:hypothetical protein